MKSRFKPSSWPLALVLAVVVSVEAAVATTAFVYSKRIETRLFSDPSPQARVTGKVVGYAKKLTIAETQGAWLKVSETDNTGWVFKGNVADAPPEKIKGIDLPSLDASKTTATAAASGFDDAAKDYANRHNMANTVKDMEWMLQQTAGVTDQQVEEYLKTQHKGEYQ